jgi:hypothetical protein
MDGRPQTIWGKLRLCIAIFCIFRVVLHFYPSWDLEWSIHGALGDIDIFCINFSDSSVIVIMTLMSIVCTRSCLRQLTAKHNDQTFRVLFYDSLFGQESQVLKSPFPILIVISLPISLWYLVTMVIYIYYNWKIEFAQFFHPLQIYPALFTVLQSLFQGCFLLWTSLPSFTRHLRNQSTFLRDTRVYPVQLCLAHLLFLSNSNCLFR